MEPKESRPGAVRRALSWVERKMVQGGRRAGRWAGKQWQMKRVRKEIRQMEARRRDLCRTLGEKVYLLFQRNQVRNRDLLVLCEEIRDLDVRIDAQEEDYRRIYVEGVQVRSPAAVEVADEPLEQPTAAGPQAATTP